jgi:hypothetical protein
MKKESDTGVVAFRPMILSSGERLKLEDQIMERALAHWRRKQTFHPSALGALRRAERETLKSRH